MEEAIPRTRRAGGERCLWLLGVPLEYMTRRPIELGVIAVHVPQRNQFEWTADAEARIAARFHSDLGSCASPNAMDFLSDAGRNRRQCGMAARSTGRSVESRTAIHRR